jgi:hypothetical protein
MVLLVLPPPDHLWIGAKSRQNLLPRDAPQLSTRESAPVAIRHKARAAYPQRRSSNANNLRNQNGWVPGICVTFQRDNFSRRF